MTRAEEYAARAAKRLSNMKASGATEPELNAMRHQILDTAKPLDPKDRTRDPAWLHAFGDDQPMVDLLQSHGWEW